MMANLEIYRFKLLRTCVRGAQSDVAFGVDAGGGFLTDVHGRQQFYVFR